MHLIDTHAHLDFSPLAEKIDDVLGRATNAGIKTIINVGANLESSVNGEALSSKYNQVYFAAGLHPHVLVEELLLGDDKKIDEQISAIFDLATSSKKIVALGEMGIDYYKIPSEFSEREIKVAQKKLFISQLELADKLSLPVIIHSRNAFNDTFEIISQFNNLKVVWHCYSYRLEDTKKILANDWMISYTANITYPKNFDSQEVLSYMPLESLMIETDAPFLAPQSVRGQTNEPCYVIEVAQKIADIRKISLHEVASVTTANAERFFNF
jgi:TatD DNase family protein